MLHHSVVFTLKPSLDEQDVNQFFKAAKQLATIEGVDDFTCHKQVSAKTNFQYGLSMNFANETAYKHYTEHPLHTQFIENYWLPHVIDFMEIDYLPYDHLIED